MTCQACGAVATARPALCVECRAEREAHWRVKAAKRCGDAGETGDEPKRVGGKSAAHRSRQAEKLCTAVHSSVSVGCGSATRVGVGKNYEAPLPHHPPVVQISPRKEKNRRSGLPDAVLEVGLWKSPVDRPRRLAGHLAAVVDVLTVPATWGPPSSLCASPRLAGPQGWAADSSNGASLDEKRGTPSRSTTGRSSPPPRWSSEAPHASSDRG